MARQYEAEGDVTELVVADRNADIVITPSEDGKARLTCWENEEAAYDIREEDGMLYIEKVEQRQNGLGAWFGFHQSGKLEVELPAGARAGHFQRQRRSAGGWRRRRRLLPHRDHRDGQRPHRTCAAHRPGPSALRNDNDSVTVENVTAETLNAETDNAPHRRSTACRQDDITLRTGNDNVRMEGVEADALEAVTDNGDVTFDGLTVRESLSLQTDNGDIRGELPGQMRDYHIESETDYDNSLPALLDGEGIFLRAVTNNGDIDVTFAE